MERNEAIESLRQLYFGANAENKAALECLIPELKESEDEKFARIVLDLSFKHEADYKFVRVYLEKQKEPLTPEEKMNHPLYLEGFDVGRQVVEEATKPAEWSEVDELLLNAAIYMVEKGNIIFAFENNKCKVSDWLKLLPGRFGLQPKQDWSEEEEKDIQEASDYLRDYANNCVQGGNSKLYLQSLADRIESLRPQPHWKPSEEQMDCLQEAIEESEFVGLRNLQRGLTDLMNSLKKL